MNEKNSYSKEDFPVLKKTKLAGEEYFDLRNSLLQIPKKHSIYCN